ITNTGFVLGSLSLGQSKINSNYTSVGQQSAIRAGDGGFDITVEGGTRLIGGQITSSQAAVDNNLNHYQANAGTETQDLHNRARYDAKSASISIGSSGGGAGVGNDSGSASSTSTAGISGIAGNETVRTGDAETGLNPIFDQDRVRQEIDAQVAITAEFGQQASKLVGDIAQAKLEEALDKRLQAKQAEVAGDTERAAQLNAQADQLQNDWGDNGIKRLAAHTVIGALTGGTSGATGAALGTLTAPLVADALKQAGVDETLAKGITALASTAAGAAAGGTAGAAAGFNEVVNNYLSHSEAKRLQELDRLLEDEENLTDTQRQALEEEYQVLHRLNLSRDLALEEACGLGGTAAACSYERSLLRVVFDSWQDVTLGPEDQDTVFAEYARTARAFSQHQQEHMERIGTEALTEMVVDSVKAPLIMGQIVGQALLGDAESQARLRAMGEEIKAFAAHPANYISESNREQLAKADALELAGQHDEADRLRIRVALENQSMLMGAGGLVASLPRIVSKIASRPGRVVPDGSSLLSPSQINAILSSPKGQRPDPSTYMSQAEINAHLAKFDDGAVRLTLTSNVERYGNAGPDGGFLMPKSEFDRLVNETGGDLVQLEHRLGLNPGDLTSGNVSALFIERPDLGKLRIPSGNEGGAINNPNWRPGGYTSGGVAEGVADISAAPFEDITIQLMGR
ncbi:DUF6862 domain-containing protein, partial [Nitrincola sp. A-D6]|uniref:DUF6862 domain-containing protein n=1 Tax=Nitrincola sp. A-D6 TaxID=1545442 RepID=UPI00190F9E02